MENNKENSGVDYFMEQIRPFINVYQEELFKGFYEKAKIIEKEELEKSFQKGEMAFLPKLDEGLDLEF